MTVDPTRPEPPDGGAATTTWQCLCGLSWHSRPPEARCDILHHYAAPLSGAGAPRFICGPTCGCGKSFDMIRVAGGWGLPPTCPHCGQQNPGAGAKNAGESWLPSTIAFQIELSALDLAVRDSHTRPLESNSALPGAGEATTEPPTAADDLREMRKWIDAAHADSMEKAGARIAELRAALTRSEAVREEAEREVRWWLDRASRAEAGEVDDVLTVAFVAWTEQHGHAQGKP